MSSLMAHSHPAAGNHQRATHSSSQLVTNPDEFSGAGSEPRTQHHSHLTLLHLWVDWQWKGLSGPFSPRNAAGSEPRSSASTRGPLTCIPNTATLKEQLLVKKINNLRFATLGTVRRALGGSLLEIPQLCTLSSA